MQNESKMGNKPESKQKKEPSKLVVTLLAVGVIAVITGGLWLLFSALSNPSGALTEKDIGTLEVRSGDKAVGIYEGLLERNEEGELTQGEAADVSSLADEVDFVPLDSTFVMKYTGKVEPKQSFALYAESEGYEKADRSMVEYFDPPTESGRYLLRVEVTWEKGKNYEKREYIFGLIVE